MIQFNALISNILAFIYVHLLLHASAKCYEVLFAYFIISEYIAARATTFISLDATAGICREVPSAITGLYFLDTNGYWSGHKSYDPSTAIYSFRMNDFIKSTEDYRSYINDQRATFKTLGEKLKKVDFAQSLLYWTSWSHETIDGTATHSWQLTGDPKVLIDRPVHDGFLSNEHFDCQVRPVTVYNPSTGKFKMTYNSTKYTSTESCSLIMSPGDLGFDSRSEATSFDITWDTVSHSTAAAINSGVSNLQSFDTFRFLRETAYHTNLSIKIIIDERNMIDYNSSTLLISW